MTEKKEYIERELALQALNELLIESCNKPIPTLKLKRAIEALPDADVTHVVRGQWTHICFDENGIPVFCCSQCGRRISYHGSLIKVIYPYCHCGAKMDGEKSETEKEKHFFTPQEVRSYQL